MERIDLFVGTHPHSDHIGQFAGVLKAFPVANVWLSGDVHTTRTFEAALDAILASEAGYHEPRAGEVYPLGSARIEVVHPARVTGDLNNGSIAMRVVYHDVAVLLTGDAETHSELEMIDRGHELPSRHSPRRSPRLPDFHEPGFLAAVRPKVAVYSAGVDNSYGHPHAEVIERLHHQGVEIYGTDVHGTVRVTTDGKSFEIAVERAPEGPTFIDHVAAGRGGCAPGQVDLNTATVAQLITIVHIGEARALELIEKRPYADVDGLLRINGIGEGRLGESKSKA